jgi:hypothetical protein
MTRARILFLLATAGASYAQTAEELRGLMRQAQHKLREAGARRGDYLYTRSSVQRELTADGAVKHERTTVARRDFVDGVGVLRVVERDGRPVREEERKRSEEALRKAVARAKTNPQGKRPQPGNQTDALLNEFPEALDYRKLGEETIASRAAVVLEYSPRAGYKPQHLMARLFEKLRGKIWIDQADGELAKAEGELFDTVTIGWGMIGKIQKGTRFAMERVKLAEGIWMPQSESMRLAARMLLLKTLAREEITSYSEYRRR